MIADQQLSEYMQVIAINQVGTWLGMQKAFPLMRDSGPGSIINVSSIGGFQSIPGASAYHSSKFAVRGMTKCAALEFAPYDIRVNSVHPGAVATDMIKIDGQDPSEFIARMVPLGRVGRSDEIAQMVLFLATDASSYCTGAEFLVDGGLLNVAQGVDAGAMRDQAHHTQ